MNKFELFCMIFYVLDAEWDSSQDQELGDFLSSANPFLFEDCSSAVTDIYEQFCEFVAVEEITVEKSYSLACKYIENLKSKTLWDAFCSIDEDEWIESVKLYLSEPHKGANPN